MSKVLSFRVEDDLAEWADSYAEERGVSRQVLLENALKEYRDLCARGVPEFRERAARQSYAGKVNCRGEASAVHPWVERNGVLVCEVCGKVKPSREDFAKATAERSEFFDGLAAPASVKKWGKVAGENQS